MKDVFISGLIPEIYESPGCRHTQTYLYDLFYIQASPAYNVFQNAI